MSSDTNSRENASLEPTECLLLIDPPANGAWNMAVDEALLNEVAATETPVLRFYQWQHPTLSLGYFQTASDRSLHRPSNGADLVRRLSGGGAILHDQELTYSLILPATHPVSRDAQQLYDVVHQTLVAELSANLGDSESAWKYELCTAPSMLPADEEPFLCFQRRAKGDILLASTTAGRNLTNHKVVGSAQRRRRGTVLQHGSILMRQSKLAPELSGISDITQEGISEAELIENLVAKLVLRLNLRLVEGKLTDQIVQTALRLRQEKYEASGWTERR